MLEKNRFGLNACVNQYIYTDGSSFIWYRNPTMYTYVSVSRMHDSVVGLRIMETAPLSWPEANFDQIVQLLIII